MVRKGDLCRYLRAHFEAAVNFVDIGRTDREQIRSRINNNDCRTFRPRTWQRPLWPKRPAIILSQHITWLSLNTPPDCHSTHHLTVTQHTTWLSLKRTWYSAGTAVKDMPSYHLTGRHASHAGQITVTLGRCITVPQSRHTSLNPFHKQTIHSIGTNT